MNKLFFLILSFLFTNIAVADDQPWVTMQTVSHHIAANPNLNEQNWGVGVEYRTSEKWKVAIGQYRNSYRYSSIYAAKIWLPIQEKNFKFGAAMGLVSGYRKENRNDLLPFVLPTVMYEGKKFGANVFAIPHVPGLPGIVTLQLKMRF